MKTIHKRDAQSSATGADGRAMCSWKVRQNLSDPWEDVTCKRCLQWRPARLEEGLKRAFKEQLGEDVEIVDASWRHK